MDKFPEPISIDITESDLTLGLEVMMNKYKDVLMPHLVKILTIAINHDKQEVPFCEFRAGNDIYDINFNPPFDNHLEMALVHFEEIEAFEVCAEINKLQTKINN